MAGDELPAWANGAGLFVDISGFTPLTESLAEELGPRRGAEELARELNRIYEALIDDLYRFGGEVLYFSGDAITCWLDGDDGIRATACALQMQETMARVGVVETPAGSTVRLSVKGAVAVGTARRFTVGNPELQLIDVMAGRLIDRLAEAEQHAEQGQVVLDASAVESLGDRVELLDDVVDLDEGTRLARASRLTVEVPSVELSDPVEELSPEIVRPWVQPTVYERLDSGGGAFFAELRNAFPMFVRFGGIDFDHDPQAPDKLDLFICEVQEILERYGGNILSVTLGDKGAYLFAVFGTPKANEDDGVRAVSAAHELQSLGVEGIEHLQIGISSGRVFSGVYGHPSRCAFTCLGDAVNLAARLMASASPGEVVATQPVVAAARGRFVWAELGLLTLKGKSQEVSAFLLQRPSEQRVRRHLRYPLPMVGREKELSVIQGRLQQATDGNRSVVGIKAEAGLGKSRMVAEVVRTIGAAGLHLAYGEAQAFGRNTSYLVWREVWRGILGLQGRDESDCEALVIERLAGVDPQYARRAPLLSGLLGVDIPDNALTAAFDAKLRKSSLESLLEAVLKHELRARPLAIVLEDCHWIDDASLDLLEVLTRATAGLPLFVLIAYRPEIEEETNERFAAVASFEEVELRELTPEDVERVILAKLEQQFGAGVIPSRAAVQLIVEKGQGNPFYIEELVNFFRRSDVDLEDARAVEALELPETLQALVLQRIDGLAEQPRTTLKVASVVGREFDLPTLPGVHRQLGEASAISAHLEMLHRADLITPDREGDDSWLFRHAITRDVAYESMPFAQRTALHESAGRYFEGRGSVDTNLDLLAHHYWHSENLEKKIEFQRRAGEAAKASYSNAAAIEYFERLASVVGDDSRPDALLKLGEVLELVGDWGRAEEVESEALGLAEAAGNSLQVGWCEVALAEAVRKQGRFEEASRRLALALTAFDVAGDAAGKGRVLHLIGTVAAQHGDLEEAQAAYEGSLRIREELDDRLGMAALLSNLGIVAEYGADLTTSRRFHERALALRTELGDRWAIANSRTNLGMISVLQKRFSEARDHFEVAMRLNREVGDSWMVALSHNNLGNAYRELGDYPSACRQYIASAEAYMGFGDKWGLAFLCEDVALLAMTLGEVTEALVLLGAADRMREDIKTPRNDALAAELSARIETVSGLAETERLAWISEGGSLDAEAAARRAVSFCSESRRSSSDS